MVSDQVKAGKERAPHRSLFFATGMKCRDIKKPFIGICNSYESFVPGHFHLNKVGAYLGARYLTPCARPRRICRSARLYGKKGIWYNVMRKEN